MLRTQAHKSAKQILLKNAWTKQQNLAKVNFHFGDKPVFGYQKDKKIYDKNLIEVESVTERELANEFRTVGHFLANIVS